MSLQPWLHYREALIELSQQPGVGYRASITYHDGTRMTPAYVNHNIDLVVMNAKSVIDQREERRAKRMQGVGHA